MKINKRGKGKKGVMTPTLIGWIIAIAILALVLVFIGWLLRDRFPDMIKYIKSLFRR